MIKCNKCNKRECIQTFWPEAKGLHFLSCWTNMPSINTNLSHETDSSAEMTCADTGNSTRVHQRKNKKQTCYSMDILEITKRKYHPPIVKKMLWRFTKHYGLCARYMLIVLVTCWLCWLHVDFAGYICLLLATPWHFLPHTNSNDYTFIVLVTSLWLDDPCNGWKWPAAW